MTDSENDVALFNCLQADIPDPSTMTKKATLTLASLATAIVSLQAAPQYSCDLTFTGYSAVCLAQGLHGQGHIHTLEINDELEDLTREGWRRAGVEELITLHIGDALETLESLPGPFDLVYIDANKRRSFSYP